MKAYILKEEDFEKLLLKIDRNPEHGREGGSSACFNKEQIDAYNDAHSFYNYQVRTWISKVKEDV